MSERDLARAESGFREGFASVASLSGLFQALRFSASGSRNREMDDAIARIIDAVGAQARAKARVDGGR